MSIAVTELNGEKWFKISGLERQRPFFMSIVSDSNHWMFISSNGGVSAGRKNSEYSLFPYYTDDKITEFAHTTGSKTIIQVLENEENKIWEPFCETNAIRFEISRNLYKNLYGNKILFEELNHDLEATFRYEWNSSDLYGFVKRSTLSNSGSAKRSFKVLDGIQNVLPASVNSDLQTRSSNLLDAYKRSELVQESGLGIYALSAIPVDKAEPSEALKANVVWSDGVDEPVRLLSSLQLDAFRKFEPVHAETDVKGEKGAYFIVKEMNVSPSSEANWSVIADLNMDHSSVIALNNSILDEPELIRKVDADVESGTEKLKQLVAASDGFQYSADELKNARHYSNVLFNIMRGGIFDDGYAIEKSDFKSYLKNANKGVFERNKESIDTLPDVFTKQQLDSSVAEIQDADLLRLSREYLPLKFSRRHGDPSRPWNRFSINTKNELDGSKVLDYEGNWRDIFQNWEALVHSYPDFIDGMIFKFLNASTFDGYNPYRVTKGGFDWEIIEPDDPWSYIGYWGDHQIIYLLKFLEFYQAYDADALAQLFSEDVFVYANVPYRIKSYEDITADPKDTIDFDFESEDQIREQIKKTGADGALLLDQKGEIHRVNFIEKILATTLSKISNFIPEAGIWMNTQRPEWNDANNALVGNGVSMVTLYYLRRFLRFFKPLLSDDQHTSISLSEEMTSFLVRISEVLEEHKDSLSAGFDDASRKQVTDELGKAGSAYRNAIYSNGFSGERKEISLRSVKEVFESAARFMEHSIEANQRTNKLYHAYNLMTYTKEGIRISYLDEMLEGQVAVLSSGYLSGEQSVEVLDALRRSSLYRADQNSYILYPNKKLPGFLQKNSIPNDAVDASNLLSQLINNGNNSLVRKDANGGYHFNGNFKNSKDLRAALDTLADTEFKELVENEGDQILQLFEEVFNHKSFTGRSGTFYGYEGLGSIYWHMVSKLYLAVYEVHAQASENQEDQGILGKLSDHFHEIGEGIGIHKDPELYGAFPTDPYSHTPFHRGAQQPGMTGQVKEDILARFGELGLEMKNGMLSFNPLLLKGNEFLERSGQKEFIDVRNKLKTVSIPAKSVCFTLCQVPVIYTLGSNKRITVVLEDKSEHAVEGSSLTREYTRMLSGRSGQISEIRVEIDEHQLH